jgi:hypothetical protein
MQQARDHFKKVSPNFVSSFYFQSKEGGVIDGINTICHAKIRNIHPYHSNPTIEVFATNAKGITPEEKRYLNWVMSRTESPWRKMFTDKDFELLYNAQGQQVGVLFPQSFLKKNNYVSIMGFVTALRLASEPTNNVGAWDNLVYKYGVHPVEALVLCSYFKKHLDEYSFSMVNSNHHTFDAYSGSVDIQKIKDGDLNWDAKTIFGLMPLGNVNLNSLYLNFIHGCERQTGVLKGSVVHTWPIEEILKVWRKVYEG